MLVHSRLEIVKETWGGLAMMPARTRTREWLRTRSNWPGGNLGLGKGTKGEAGQEGEEMHAQLDRKRQVRMAVRKQ